MLASVLDQVAGDRVGLFGILRRACPDTGLLDLTLDLRRKPLPHQLFSEIDRGRDEHEPRDARICRRSARQFAAQQQREPASHRRADHDLRLAAKRFKYGERLLEPAADGALGEISAGLAVAGVIEARRRPAIRLRPSIECLGLGTSHVGLETTDPKQAGRRSLAPAHSNLPGRSTSSNRQEFRANIAHRRRLTLGTQTSAGSGPRMLPLNTSMP